MARVLGVEAMFTGLVRAVGSLERCAGGVRVRLAATHAAGESGAAGATSPEAGLGRLSLGDSIAVDGVCLTAAELLPDGFRADVSEETLGRTTLAARAAAGATVNLEPALRLSDRLGGHLVSGHVDGLGVVSGIQRLPGSWRLALRWQEPSWGRYICEKASVAVDGISLTVAGCGSGTLATDREDDGASFWIAVIPHTWAETTLSQRRVGDPVNLEADLLAKYTERLLQGRGTAAAGGATPLDGRWLAEHGWG